MKYNWDDKSNNEILLEIKQIQLEHEALKLKIINEYDKLVELENKFYEAQNIVKQRITGKK
jgi:hypothetical protein